MRKNKPKPVPPPHPKGIPNVPVAQLRPGWRVMTGVQLSLYDVPGIQTIHIRRYATVKDPAASYQQAPPEVSCYGINLTGHPEL